MKIENSYVAKVWSLKIALLIILISLTTCLELTQERCSEVFETELKNKIEQFFTTVVLTEGTIP